MGHEHIGEDGEVEEYADLFPDDTFRRVVYLPGGEGTQQGPIIRGLGGGRR